MRSFQKWLEAGQSEVPDSMQIIAQAEAAGIAHRDLRRAMPALQPETLDRLLAALADLGEITVTLVNGHRIYRGMG